MADPVKFPAEIKVTDAVFIVTRTPEKKFKLKGVLKVYAVAAGIKIMDGDIKETDCPIPFETEDKAFAHAERTAHIMKLSEFTFVNSSGGERRIKA